MGRGAGNLHFHLLLAADRQLPDRGNFHFQRPHHAEREIHGHPAGLIQMGRRAHQPKWILSFGNGARTGDFQRHFVLALIERGCFELKLRGQAFGGQRNGIGELFQPRGLELESGRAQ